MLGDADDLDARPHGWCPGHAHGGRGLGDDGSLSVRIRYRSRPIPCTVRRVKNLFPEEGGSEELGLVRFKEKASAVTPGQSAVFYVGDKMVGGATSGFANGGCKLIWKTEMEALTLYELNGWCAARWNVRCRPNIGCRPN